MLNGKFQVILLICMICGFVYGYCGKIFVTLKKDLTMGCDDAFAESNVTYLVYNWIDIPHSPLYPSTGAIFVPMIWSLIHATPAILNAVKISNSTLPGFNEPECPDQANMSVESAIAAWPMLEKTGMRLGSPASGKYTGYPWGWLHDFMRQAITPFLAIWHCWSGRFHW